MDQNITEDIAKNSNKSIEEVRAITTEFMKLLHKTFFECDDDFFGAPLYFNAGREGYFHFMGMIELFASRYNSWEPGYSQEYIGRLGLYEDWEPFIKEMKKWKTTKKI